MAGRRNICKRRKIATDFQSLKKKIVLNMAFCDVILFSSSTEVSGTSAPHSLARDWGKSQLSEQDTWI